MIDSELLIENLINRFGLPLRYYQYNSQNENEFFLGPKDLHPNNSFRIRIQLGWKTLSIDFLQGKFAGDLIKGMERVSSQKKDLFVNIARQIINNGAQIQFNINEKKVDPLKPDSWVSGWYSINFILKIGPKDFDNYSKDEFFYFILRWTERFLGCILALSPLEENIEDIPTIGDYEGAKLEKIVNQYERSRYNRSLCISFHGVDCKICNFNFEKVYGEIGKDFIHVHHIVPISQVEDNYIPDPVNDLVPICPNCHAMVHKKDPPFTIDEIKEVINK